MATLKRNSNGKIILKNGKVSCGCCDLECCMYPAQALIDGLYTVDDLPDEVLFNDGSRPPTILQKTLDPELVGGVGYPWPEDGSDDAGIYFIVINDGSDPITWAFGDDRGEGSFPCLIQGDGNLTPNNNLSEDQFADTYNWLSDDPFTGDPYNPVSTTVTRVSLCRWEGPLLPFVEGTIFCKPVLYLYKGLNDVPNEYAFVWRMQWEGDAAETGGDKIGFNNTPVGEYDADPTPGTWVIS